MPPVHERDHEHVHAEVPGSVVVNGRLVADGEVQVVVDLVPEREPDAEVVELLPRNTVDARFAAVVPGAVDRPRSARSSRASGARPAGTRDLSTTSARQCTAVRWHKEPRVSILSGEHKR